MLKLNFDGKEMQELGKADAKKAKKETPKKSARPANKARKVENK